MAEEKLNEVYVEVANYLETNKEELLAMKSENMFDYRDDEEDVDDWSFQYFVQYGIQ